MQLHPTTHLGSTGKAVEADKRAVARLLGGGRLLTLVEQPKAVRRTFGIFFRSNVKKAQKQLGIPSNGVVGPVMQDALYAGGWYDRKALDLMGLLGQELIEPYQGFQSLHKELWEAYSVGVGKYGLWDGPHHGHPTASGTYAKGSTLPGGGKSDHAYYPSYAFDLDIIEHTGWKNLNARTYFYDCVQRSKEWNIEYVILGDWIWSRDRGLHPYTSGGHDNHIHVSGTH